MYVYTTGGQWFYYIIIQSLLNLILSDSASMDLVL